MRLHSNVLFGLAGLAGLVTLGQGCLAEDWTPPWCRAVDSNSSACQDDKGCAMGAVCVKDSDCTRGICKTPCVKDSDCGNGNVCSTGFCSTSSSSSGTGGGVSGTGGSTTTTTSSSSSSSSSGSSSTSTSTSSSSTSSSTSTSSGGPVSCQPANSVQPGGSGQQGGACAPPSATCTVQQCAQVHAPLGDICISPSGSKLAFCCEQGLEICASGLCHAAGTACP